MRSTLIPDVFAKSESATVLEAKTSKLDQTYLICIPVRIGTKYSLLVVRNFGLFSYFLR